MKPQVIAALVDSAIPFFGGLVCTLMAFRVIGPRAGQSIKHDEWVAKYGSALKVLGPLLMIFAVILFGMGVSRPPAATP